MEPKVTEVWRGSFRLTTDPALVDVDVVHRYLSEESYWAHGRPRDVVARSIEHSALVVSALHSDGAYVGFARLVTDLSTFAWLCDVFVLPEYSGQGLGVALVELLVEHPHVKGVKRFLLATEDAHGLYRRFGFEELATAEPIRRWMTRPERTA